MLFKFSRLSLRSPKTKKEINSSEDKPLTSSSNQFPEQSANRKTQEHFTFDNTNCHKLSNQQSLIEHPRLSCMNVAKYIENNGKIFEQDQTSKHGRSRSEKGNTISRNKRNKLHGSTGNSFIQSTSHEKLIKSPNLRRCCSERKPKNNKSEENCIPQILENKGTVHVEKYSAEKADKSVNLLSKLFKVSFRKSKSPITLLNISHPKIVVFTLN